MASTSPADTHPSDESPASSQEAPQSLAARGSNRSRQPENQAFRDFIGSGWGPRPEGLPARSEAAPWAAARREALGRLFPGERLVLPAGALKVRNNDCDYRFRPHSAFAHLAGTGTDFEPDAVLVLDPLTEPSQDAGSPDGSDDTDDVAPTHEAVLYFRPRASRSSQEFYGDPRYGELWVGVRPSLEEVEASTGMRCAHIDSLPDALAKDAGPDAVQLRVVAEADESVTALVTTTREKVGLQTGQGAAEVDAGLAEAASELRLVKDPWEIDQLRAAVAATKAGFDDLIRSIPRARGHWRGERVLEGAFGAKAREEGNGLGYDTIAAAGNHANTLHWINNDGAVEPGQLVLVDAGVEVDSLYTADVTRTIPVDGRFTEAQRRIYQAVLDAADAAFARAGTPGCRFKDVHAAAMEVIAARLEEWGCCPRASAPPTPWPPRASTTGAGWCTAPATTWAWMSTTAPRRAARCTWRPSSSRACASPSNRDCTSARTTCWCPPRCVARACASRTTSWCARTAAWSASLRTCPAPWRRSRPG